MDTEISTLENGKYFNQYGQELITCELCFAARTTMLSTKRCDRCWELETRIRTDLRLEKKIIARLEGGL